MAGATLVACSSLACSVQAENYTTEEGAETTHVVTRIEKVVQEDGQVQGSALAGFVRLPASADPAVSLRLAGLREGGPRVGECRETEAAGPAEETSSEGESEGGELLDAGEVEVVTTEGVHALAPHAFPSAYDLLRGVLYSSRTQDGVSLPAGESYRLNTTLDELPASLRESRHEGPSFPDEIQVNGENWEQVVALPDSDILELSWEPSSGDQVDHVVVDLSTDTHSLTCRFLDADGYGPVPLLSEDGQSWLVSAASAAETDAVRLSIARQRSTSASAPSTAQSGPYRLEFNFDFSRSRLLPLDDAN